MTTPTFQHDESCAAETAEVLTNSPKEVVQGRGLPADTLRGEHDEEFFVVGA